MIINFIYSFYAIEKSPFIRQFLLIWFLTESFTKHRGRLWDRNHNITSIWCIVIQKNILLTRKIKTKMEAFTFRNNIELIRTYKMTLQISDYINKIDAMCAKAFTSSVCQRRNSSFGVEVLGWEICRNYRHFVYFY